MNDNLDAVFFTGFVDAVQRLESSKILNNVTVRIASLNGYNGIVGYIRFRAMVADLRPLIYLNEKDELSLERVNALLKNYDVPNTNKEHSVASLNNLRFHKDIFQKLHLDNFEYSSKEIIHMIIYAESVHYNNIELLKRWYALTPTERNLIYFEYASFIMNNIMPILSYYKEYILENQKINLLPRRVHNHRMENYNSNVKY